MKLNTQQVWAIDREDAVAWKALMKIVQKPLRPGMVIPLTNREYKALQRSVLVLQIELPPKESTT